MSSADTSTFIQLVQEDFSIFNPEMSTVSAIQQNEKRKS